MKKLFLLLSLCAVVGLQAVVMHRNRARRQTTFIARMVDSNFPHVFVMPNGDVHHYDPENGLVSPIVYYNLEGLIQRINGENPTIITHEQWAAYNLPRNQRYNNIIVEPEPVLDVED